VLGQENEGLVSRVSRVYETSERVGGKVRRLDEEIGRVRQSADVVTEVLELKNSLANLRGYIEKHDWENAARACRRAMDVRPDVLNGGFAATVVVSSSDQAASTANHELRIRRSS
jgi:predicted nuclease with TOPRIM domain